MALAKRLQNGSSLLASMDAFVFDCDGVIWRGGTMIEGADAVLAKLREDGKKVVFVTNNSTKTTVSTHRFCSFLIAVEAPESHAAFESVGRAAARH